MALGLIIAGIAAGVALAAAAVYYALKRAGKGADNNFCDKKVGDTKQSCPLATPKTYGKAIKIEGDEEFRKKTIAALDQINKTKTGSALLDSLDKSGKVVTIKPTKKGNRCTFSNDAFIQANGKKGKGSNSTVYFNPDRKTIGSKKWETRPPAIGLAHELIHAQHGAEGSIDIKKVQNDEKKDPSNPKAFAKTKAEEVRTVGLSPYENEPYTENKIRSEWKPKQPTRKWY